MNFYIAICDVCERPMTLRELREGVYWLPDMDDIELSWAHYEGFVHNFAHRVCWKNLKEKRKDLIRLCSFKDQEPRSMGGKV